MLAERLADDLLRRPGRRLPVIAEEVDLVVQLGDRVDRGQDAPQRAIQLEQLEHRHAAVGPAAMRVLVVADEAGVDDGGPARHVDHGRVGGELGEEALGEHAMEEELRLVLQRAHVRGPPRRLHDPARHVQEERAPDPAGGGRVHQRRRREVAHARGRWRTFVPPEILERELFEDAGEGPPPRRASGEDRAVHRAALEERFAATAQVLFEPAGVVGAVHPHRAPPPLVVPGVTGDVRLAAVEEAGLEGGRRGGGARAAGRDAVAPRVEQLRDVRHIALAERRLELRMAHAVEVEQQQAPSRGQRRPGLAPSSGDGTQQVAHQRSDGARPDPLRAAPSPPASIACHQRLRREKR